MDRHGQATGAVPLLCLLVVGGSIGVTNNLARLGSIYGAVPLALLFWSVLGAALLLAILAVGLRRPPVFDRRTLTYGLVSGLLLMALPTGITYLAAPHVGAGFLSLSLAFIPLMTYLLAVVLRIEANRWLRLAGVFAGLAGALLLAFGKSRMPDAQPLWIAATLAIPVTIAIGNIYRTRYWPPGAASLSLAPLMLAGAGLWLLPFAAPAAGSIVASASGATLAAAQAAVFTLTYALYFILQRLSGAVYLSQIGSVGAVAGAAIAVVGFDERLPPGFAVSAVLIVAGLALFNLRGRGA